MPIDSRTFRDAMGRFASGVTVITTTASDGRPSGFTATSLCSVSLDPPLVLFCLGRRADIFDDFNTADHFAINILRRDQEHMSQRFAARGVEVWEGVAYDSWPSGCPMLPGVLATMECRKVATHDGGDHAIIVGEMLQAVVDDDGVDPLVYHCGAYHGLS
jgi:flavin reductase (DIM6/NTAB) family NADH-FMN oxidoreductase RutF